MRLMLSGLHRDPISGKKHLDSNFEVPGIKMASGMLGKYSISELYYLALGCFDVSVFLVLGADSVGHNSFYCVQPWDVSRGLSV